MHKPANTTKHTEVEIWGVKHILENDPSMMDPDVKKEINAAVADILSTEYGSTEYIEFTSYFLSSFYQYKSKYEFIYFIRQLVLNRILLRYADFPLFKDVVSNLGSVVRNARNLLH